MSNEKITDKEIQAFAFMLDDAAETLAFAEKQENAVKFVVAMLGKEPNLNTQTLAARFLKTKFVEDKEDCSVLEKLTCVPRLGAQIISIITALEKSEQANILSMPNAVYYITSCGMSCLKSVIDLIKMQDEIDQIRIFSMDNVLSNLVLRETRSEVFGIIKKLPLAARFTLISKPENYEAFSACGYGKKLKSIQDSWNNVPNDAVTSAICSSCASSVELPAGSPAPGLSSGGATQHFQL